MDLPKASARGLWSRSLVVKIFESLGAKNAKIASPKFRHSLSPMRIYASCIIALEEMIRRLSPLPGK